MKHFRFIHALAGIALAISWLALPFLTGDSKNFSLLAQSESLLILAAAVCNLSLGSYFSAHYGGKRTVQLFGSLLVLASSACALIPASGQPVTFDAALFSVGMLLGGTFLHFLCGPPAVTPSFSAEAMDPGREAGTVKWFNVSKGFGFITRDQGDDIFVHYRAIRGEGHRVLHEGQRVEFLVASKEKGLQAEDVISAPNRR
ncbi:cold-shock protein [Endozoicomonadaceae bacterium StTr2]